MTNNYTLCLKIISLVFILNIFQGCKKNESIQDNSSKINSVATIITNTPTKITLTSGLVGGEIINNGSDSITEKGICYNNFSNPTVQNQKVICGFGTAGFEKTLLNLALNTKYYVRAYAINSIGIAYGNEQILKTNSVGLLYKIVDSLNNLVFDSLTYNNNYNLSSYFVNSNGPNTNASTLFTFSYNSNNLLEKSFYYLSSIPTPTTQYTTSEYFYLNNKLTNSKYVFGASNLLSTSIYTIDNQNRVIQFTQTKVTPNVGYVPPTYTSRCEYDANSNLSKVYHKENGYPEYLTLDLSNYDNNPNPYYTLPWFSDQGGTQNYSKNNVGKIISYFSFQGGVPVIRSTTYQYEYNFDGKISKRTGGDNGTKIFLYKYL